MYGPAAKRTMLLLRRSLLTNFNEEGQRWGTEKLKKRLRKCHPTHWRYSSGITHSSPPSSPPSEPPDPSEWPSSPSPMSPDPLPLAVPPPLPFLPPDPESLFNVLWISFSIRSNRSFSSPSPSSSCGHCISTEVDPPNRLIMSTVVGFTLAGSRTCIPPPTPMSPAPNSIF